jgi:hypothetical protein
MYSIVQSVIAGEGAAKKGPRLREHQKVEFTRWAASLQLSSWLFQSRGRTTKIDADLDPSVLNLSRRTTNDLRLL